MSCSLGQIAGEESSCDRKKGSVSGVAPLVAVKNGREPTEKELVKRAKGGEREAFRELVERYQGRVFHLAFDVLKNREDAEDVIQESFVKAYLSLDRFKGDSSFYTWLYRIVYNMSIDVRRKVQRRATAPFELDESRAEVESVSGSEFSTRTEAPDRVYQYREELKLVDAALSELSEEHRVVLLLRERDGLSYEEIADVVGVARGTVMSRLHYARKELLKKMEAQNE